MTLADVITEMEVYLSCLDAREREAAITQRWLRLVRQVVQREEKGR